MSVLYCSRRNCDEIMCRTYIDSVGYICSDCKEEFKIYLASEKKHVHTDRQIRKELNLFMETSKGEFENEESTINIDQFFRDHTR